VAPLRFSLLLLLSGCVVAPPAPRVPPAAPPVPPEPAAVAALPPPAPPPPPPPLRDLELAAHRALFDALRARDPKALAALYADDAVVDVGVGLTEAKGRDAVATLAGALWAAFPDSQVQWGTLLQSGDTLAVELAWTGTHTAALGDHAPTKKVLGTALLLLETFTPAGLIASQRLYFDADAIVSDLATRAGKPHAFEGLPTTQVTARDDVPAASEDAAARGVLTTALANGATKELLPLGSPATLWVEETRRHTTEGKGAVPAWAYFAGHAFPAGTKPVTWASADRVVVEWNAPPKEGAHAAEVIALEGGRIKSVHTYVSAKQKKAGRSPSP
jgi:ketosteroid isomerase-like protein